MKKFLLFLIVLGVGGYFVYTTYIQGHGGGTAARGLSRMRGQSKEMDEVQNAK